MVESIYDYERMSSGSGLASISLSGVQHVDAQGAVLASHGYTYDDAGLVDTYTSDDGQAAYSYDATGQLVDADYDYQDDESFNYDANGNRLEYIVGVNNQVLSDGLYWYEYDEEGARSEKYQWDDLDADGEVDDDERFDVTSYTWDARGRLTKITTKPDGQTTTRVVQYAYDYLNRRVEKKIDDGANPKTAERYTYLGHDIVLQTDKQGDLTHRYLHGPAVDQCLADEAILDDNTLYPLFDNQGSVRDVADHNPSTGQTSIVNHILYDAFGRIVLQTDPTNSTIYGHTGRETDAESNLAYHRRRYYDAALGQFISEDPIGFASSDMNLYRYAGNSPTNATDPSGLEHLPADRRGDWISGTRGNGVFKYSNIPINRDTHLVGVEVRYVDGVAAPGGFPNNAYYLSDPEKAWVPIKKVTGTGADDTAADKAMREMLDDPDWKRPNDYTWHHSGKPGSKRMELVLTKYHRRIAHEGNATLVRAELRRVNSLKGLRALGLAAGALGALDRLNAVSMANEEAGRALPALVNQIKNVNNERSLTANEKRVGAVTAINAYISRYDSSPEVQGVLYGFLLWVLGKDD